MALAADIMIDKIIKLLRSAKGDEDILMEKSFDRKPGIIKYFIKNGFEDGWDFMTIFFPSIVRKLIFYEVIDYCKHCSRVSGGKDLKSFAKLDDDTIFNLIMECIRYCRKAFVNGGNLFFEFDMLLNILTIVASRQTFQANIRSSSTNSKSIDISLDALLGNCLLDTLLIHNHADQAKKSQENQEYSTRQVYAFEEGPSENYLKLFKLFGDFYTYLESPKLVIEGENLDAENFVINEGACADLKPCPDSKLVGCSDILGRLEENTDNSSCDEVGEGGSQEAEDCVLNEGAYAVGLKPRPDPIEVYRKWLARFHLRIGT